MTLIIAIVVAVALVAGVGILIFTLRRRSSNVVPDTADGPATHRDRVVAVDDQGRPVMESEAGDGEVAAVPDAAQPLHTTVAQRVARLGSMTAALTAPGSSSTPPARTTFICRERRS